MIHTFGYQIAHLSSAFRDSCDVIRFNNQGVSESELFIGTIASFSRCGLILYSLSCPLTFWMHYVKPAADLSQTYGPYEKAVAVLIDQPGSGPFALCPLRNFDLIFQRHCTLSIVQRAQSDDQAK